MVRSRQGLPRVDDIPYSVVLHHAVFHLGTWAQSDFIKKGWRRGDAVTRNNYVAPSPDLAFSMSGKIY